ncbi:MULTISPECIES: MerR family transcriptional regulator [Streptomyces]|uniref:MerR family transcriptional regulator n=2 Tax=Streptomyces rimosus subsp. rimosus TaxID=132474 RepID=L8F4C9_STRR1|nr:MULTISPECIES: MerR family transcriptional regulator [Streptomyces]KOG70735.1 MerR family transcriptional regulator [Kitasatospora aureofaciens]MYT47069.1 MerR family transcriptional regulator [Streptomyces sp. SID5471]KEF08082.1 MerR family transcriptional regulator [Streptomyces rimosus]KEF20955.1 MerR family transcriptional regulator [Streptomyces rimosus]KOT29900.1 MerR family transcriptional regulator [Streptomyces rimosus subsp. rimosus]
MRIGELAERAGTTTRTLRYYEARGLLHAERTPNGHRTYSESDLRLLQQIRMLQRFGFELEETRPFVECLRAGHPAGDSCPALLQVYRRKIAELDACIARLQDVREQVGDQLSRAEQALGELANASAQPGGPHPRCELSSPDV